MKVLKNLTAVAPESSPVIESITPASGKELKIYKYISYGALNNDVKIEMYWDDTLIFVSHETISEDVTYHETESYVTDGTKKLEIKNYNDSAQTETFGGKIVYELF